MNKLKRQLYKYLPVLKLFGLGVLIILGLAFLKLTAPFFKDVLLKTFKGPKLAFSLLTADTSSLDSYNNRTNILLLGVSGGDSFGSDLTDTMIFTSIDKNDADTVMLSLPRDIWLESLQAKINTAYYYGEEKKEGGGFVLVKDAVYEVVNQPIHYILLIDFQGFVKMVDLLGGLDIKVDKSFDDYKYPIKGREDDECNGDPDYKCRYEHLHFEVGSQHMNGETVLKYVRSRNAEGEEGTDFARSQRQKKVILALKDKALSLDFLLNPKKIMEVRKTLGENVKMDIQFSEEQITAFLSLFLRFSKNNNQIRSLNLDYGDKDSPGFLYNPPEKEYGQWVLIPRDNDWTDIHKHLEEKIYKRY
jgi:polyisoprenyl-teichoic acid--peptidoglycan teichoic acid transferase